MERQIEWTWPRQMLSVVVAAALVCALLLVVQRPAGAEPLASAATAQQATQTAIGNVVTAQQAASIAIALPNQAPAVMSSRALPPVIVAICVILLRLRAVFIRLGPFFRFLVAIINGLIRTIGRGCVGVSGV